MTLATFGVSSEYDVQPAPAGAPVIALSPAACDSADTMAPCRAQSAAHPSAGEGSAREADCSKKRRACAGPSCGRGAGDEVRAHRGIRRMALRLAGVVTVSTNPTGNRGDKAAQIRCSDSRDGSVPNRCMCRRCGTRSCTDANVGHSHPRPPGGLRICVASLDM
jgi:hypothetical protein